MKKTALISAIMLSGTAAYSAETPAETTQAAEPAACCPQTADNQQCGDECWLDIETITVEAANGNPIAQYVIAWVTDNGLNNEPADPEKAKAMYAEALPGLEKAAAEGDPSACCALAKMYATGKGVEKNPEKAKELMERCKQLMKEKSEADAKPDKAEN